ncbi:MAG: ATP-binding protein [Bacteroidota bacterium]
MIKSIWHWVSHLGVEGPPSIQGKLTIYLNQTALLTSFGAFITTIVCSFFFPNRNYMLVTSFLTLAYFLVPVLHSFKKPFWVKFLIIFILPNWIYFIILVAGTFFGQGLASVATIILGYFFFQDKKWLQKLAIWYNVILYVITTSYAAFFPQIIPMPEVPLDEAIVYVISLCWIFVIFPIYDLEKEKLIESLRKKNVDLENTTAELKRFTHIASHDLKSPLRTIISFLGLMERDLKRKNYDNLSQNLDFAKSGAQQLNYLVEDVLELSKINGNKSVKKEKVNLLAVLEKVKSNLNAELLEKNISINADELPSIVANETEMILLFQNIIHNGIKYNESSKPFVSIWSNQLNGFQNIYFHDNGIGIDEEYHEQIFEHFKRLHNSDKYSGTGLGLSLCKKIMDKYEGKIRVNSKAGEGSTFSISFPMITANSGNSKIIEPQISPTSF